MELPQAQFALDPCVAKFHDPATTTVLLLRFRTGHFFPEREHRRNFFNTLQSAASLLIPGTTLGLERAAVAVFRLRFVTVGHYAWLFFCCAVLVGAATCRQDTGNDLLPADTRTHSGAACWERSSLWRHLPVAYCPENPSSVPPFLR